MGIPCLFVESAQVCSRGSLADSTEFLPPAYSAPTSVSEVGASDRVRLERRTESARELSVGAAFLPGNGLLTVVAVAVQTCPVETL